MSTTQPDAHYELLQGIGAVTPAPNGANTHQVRIVPIGENDVTVGQSEQRTRWDRDALKAAVDNGAFDGAKIVKGKGGEGHFALDEQVPPERLLGRVDEWDYEEGVGPVGEAQLLDESLAEQIDMGLLDVSADMIRHLGEYDESADAYNVDEIVAVPRVTVLDRGASGSASIELTSAAGGVAPARRAGDDAEANPASVEQLAGALGVDEDAVAEYLQDDITVSQPVYSGTVEDSWDAPTLDGTYDGDMEAAREAALIHRGNAETFDDLSLFVVDGGGNLNLAALRAAKSRAPQTSGVEGDVLSRVQTTINRLASEEFDVEWDDEEQNAAADDYDPAAVEQLQSAGDAVRWESDAGGEREPANYRYGVVVDELQDGPEDSVLVAVYQPTSDYDGWEARDEQNPISEDTLEVVGSDGVASLPPVSQVTEQNAAADGPPQPADDDTGGSDPADAGSDDSALEGLLRRIASFARGLVPSTGDPQLDEALEGLGSPTPEADYPPTGTRPESVHGSDTFEQPIDADYSGESLSDERAESRVESDAVTDTTTTTMQNTDPSPQEQLADARATIRSMKADLEEKEDEVEGLREEIEEKEETIEALEDEKADLEAAEDDLEALREQIKPWQETLAEIAAADSMLDSETIAETHSFEQLSNTVVDQLADDDDDVSPMDRLREQLAGDVKPRGETSEETTEEIDDAQEAQAEQLAESVMGLSDWRRANSEQLSSREYVKQQYGVDPAEANSEAELRRKIASQGGD